MFVWVLVAVSCYAGFESTKRRYQNDLKQLRKRYLHQLRRDRDSMVRYKKDTTEIDKEIDRIKCATSSLAGKYHVAYKNAGTRVYTVSADKVTFQKITVFFKYKDGKLTFDMENGQVETWTRRDDGNWDVVHYNRTHNATFKGIAKKIKK
jgi:uncharacterized iron-regulated membrane protein